MVACAIASSCVEQPAAEVAHSWRAQLGKALPAEVSSVTVIENDWDRQMRLFLYAVPSGGPPESIGGVVSRFVVHYPCYRAISQSASEVHLRCPDGAKQHWWADDYAFHVCPRGRTVIGLSFDGHISAYEKALISEAVVSKCGHS